MIKERIVQNQNRRRISKIDNQTNSDDFLAEIIDEEEPLQSGTPITADVFNNFLTKGDLENRVAVDLSNLASYTTQSTLILNKKTNSKRCGRNGAAVGLMLACTGKSKAWGQSHEKT